MTTQLTQSIAALAMNEEMPSDVIEGSSAIIHRV